MLHLQPGGDGERLVGIDAGRLQGADDGVDLALHVHAVVVELGGVGAAELGEAGVLEHRFGIAFQELRGGQRRALAGQHGLIGALPLGREIGWW